MSFSDHAETRIHYVVAGQGTGMVFVHANPFDARLWLYQTARFSSWFKVIALDLRAYGHSDRTEHSYDMDALVRDVLAAADQEALDKVILCGCSVGAKIALQLAITYPERVSALVLVGGNSAPSPRADVRISGFRKNPVGYQAAYLRELVAPTFRDSPLGRYLLTMFEEAGGRLSALALERLFTAANDHDMTPELSKMRVPTLVVNGEHDHSLDVGRKTASLIPDARHALLPGAGHACCLESPQAFDSLVLNFLNSHGLMPPTFDRTVPMKQDHGDE